jgi:hypothetical protein
MPPEPPPIARLKGHGLKGLFVTCCNPRRLHAAPLTFVALGLPDETLFPTLLGPSANDWLNGAHDPIRT